MGKVVLSVVKCVLPVFSLCLDSDFCFINVYVAFYCRTFTVELILTTLSPAAVLLPQVAPCGLFIVDALMVKSLLMTHLLLKMVLQLFSLLLLPLSLMLILLPSISL